MSVASLTALAVERDLAPAGLPPMGGKRSTPTPAAAAGVQPDAAAAPGGVPQTFIDTLTSAIPTEPLVAYTAVIGIVTAVTDPSTGNYLPFRCWAAGVFVVLTAAAVLVSYRSKAAVASPAGPAATKTVPRPFRRLMIAQQGRAVPVPELISAVVAAAAWGAAMPGGPLSVAFTGPVPGHHHLLHRRAGCGDGLVPGRPAHEWCRHFAQRWHREHLPGRRPVRCRCTRFRPACRRRWYAAGVERRGGQERSRRRPHQRSLGRIYGRI